MKSEIDKTNNIPNMLSDDGINELHGSLHRESVEKGLEQAEQYLTHELATQDILTQRATDLLKFSTTLMSIIFVSLGFIIANSVFINNYIIIEIFIFGLLLLIACIFFLWSLKITKYGTLGRYPDTWLQKDIIDGDEDSRTTTLAYILRDYYPLIRESVISNDRKASFLNKGIWCIFIALCVAIIGILLLLIQ